MRIKGTFYFEGFPTGTTDFYTVDGRALRLDSQLGYKADYAYELARLSAAPDDFPVDGVACRIWLADAEGRIWSTVSQFTSEYFVDELAFANFENFRDYHVFERAPSDIQALFEKSLILEGVRFTSDDRFYRSMRIGGEWVQAIFKYSELTFDVALKNSSESSPTLYARLRQGAAYDSNQPLAEIRHTDELPALVFELWEAPERMLYAHGARFTPHGAWTNGPLPQALVFQITKERGEPQSAVRAIDAPVQKLTGS